MKASTAIVRSAVALGLLLALAGLAGTTAAQPYPPPVGSLSVESSDTTPSAGGSTTLTATVLDDSGNPVADAEVVFQIESQPGDDAAFSNGLTEITGTTDENGIATAVLSAGSTPGEVVVTMIAGDKTSQLTLEVQSAAGGGAPPTGTPPGQGDGGLAPWQAALIAAGVAILLAGGAVVIRRRT